ncbi:MAG TPA: DsbC family protein, partial [Syntrophales bacterium]|nr:DsbC family protein [Syntrophales bacterium]
MLKKIMPAVMAMFLCAAVSHAEESITIQILHKSFPNVKAEKAGKSVIPGLYEVEAGNNVFYFEPRNGYLIFGDIITKEGKNLSAEKRQELLARRVKEIPLEKGIKIGDGKSVVIEFTDPDCPFCRKAADWFEKNREGVTRYVFLYPITRLHTGAAAKPISSAHPWVPASSGAAGRRPSAFPATSAATTFCRTASWWRAASWTTAVAG